MVQELEDKVLINHTSSILCHQVHVVAHLLHTEQRIQTN